MSTPVQQDELSPDDPKYYAPPKWRTGEKKVCFPESAGSAGWTSRDGDAVSRAPEHSDEHHDHPGEVKYNRVRITALACAVGVIAWTAFCVAVGLGRIDTPAFAQLRKAALLSEEPNDPLNERLQAANDALNTASHQIFSPTLVVADASGFVNAPLPLAVRVTNYTPDTTVNLSGLPNGTVLSGGTDAGEGNWRVAIDDLPNTRVIPPSDYVGPMTVVAELRRGDDQAIVRAPVRLTWSAPPSDAVEAGDSDAPASLPDTLEEVPAPTEVLSEKTAAHQAVLSETQPRHAKARKHTAKFHSAAVRRHHRLPSSQQTDRQADLDAHSASMPFNLFASPNFAFERKQFWSSDLQSNTDSNWWRCERGSICGRATLR
jgi:hypothetical protein